MKILIAEDDYTSRLMLQVILDKWKYNVVTAADGYEAWELLQQKEPPQIAILDWEMPGMDGLEVCCKT
ncbi:MAG: response regulator, partial [Desulfopila sp.]|nr:response regulator [Desulfopila sp.]